ISAHGDPGDSAGRAIPTNRIFFLDVGHELGEEEVAVADTPVGGVDVKRGLALRGHDEAVVNLMLTPKVLDDIPPARFEKSLLVVTETMEKIENRVLVRRMGRCCRIVA